MGTNFYRCKVYTPEEQSELHSLLDKWFAGEVDEWDFTSRLEELRDSHRIHLCKRSCGWQILWQKHPYYEDNLESIKNFLQEPGTYIKDEYGDQFTLDQFLNDELEGKRCSKYLRDDLYNHEKYINDPTVQHGPYDYESREWTSKDGLRFTNDEFS